MLLLTLTEYCYTIVTILKLNASSDTYKIQLHNSYNIKIKLNAATNNKVKKKETYNRLQLPL